VTNPNVHSSCNTTKERNIMKAFSNPNNPLNTYRHICYVPERQQFRLTMPGRDTSYHGSLAAAQRARDEFENGPPAPGPAPITPGAYGYMRERAIATPNNLEQRQTIPEFNPRRSFTGGWAQ
jgi:hypothetical protein